VNNKNGVYARWRYCNYEANNPSSSQFLLPYVNCDDIGQVFIYLKQGDKRICFSKMPVTDFYDPDADIQWIEMLPDRAIGKVTENHQAGVIGFKIYIKEMKEETVFNKLTNEDEVIPAEFKPENNALWKVLI